MAKAKSETHSVLIDGLMMEVRRIDDASLVQDLSKCFEQFTRTVLPAVRAMEKAFVEFTVAVQIAAADLLAAIEATQEGEWWKNGGQPPLYKHSPNTPEWWQRGDEPPMFDSAA